MSDIITTLHPENDESTNLYPNIKKENIPNKSIDFSKVSDAINSLLNSINELHPSGVNTSTNILAFNTNRGIFIGSDNGHWYYWNGTQYVDGGVYQSHGVGFRNVNTFMLDYDINNRFDYLYELYDKCEKISFSLSGNANTIYQFKKDEIYCITISSTVVGNFQVGTYQSGAYVDYTLIVTQDLNNYKWIFKASNNAASLYVYNPNGTTDITIERLTKPFDDYVDKIEINYPATVQDMPFFFKKGNKYKLVFSNVSSGTFQVGTQAKKGDNVYIDSTSVFTKTFENMEWNFIASGDATDLTVYRNDASTHNLIVTIYTYDKEDIINNSTVLYDFNGIKNDEIDAESWTQFDDHIRLTHSGGSSTYFTDGAVSKKYITAANRVLIYDLIVNSGGLPCFYTKGAGLETFFDQGWCIHMNFNQNAVIISNKYNGTSTLPNNYVSYVILGLSNYIGKRVRVIIKRNYLRGISLSMIDLEENKKVFDINTPFDSNTVPTYGLGYDKMAICSLTGTIDLYSMKTIIPNSSKTYLYIVGDSITEGVRIKPDNAYAYMVANKIPNTIVSGRGGGRIEGVLAKLETEARLLKPKYIMVTIGTNGGNTLEKLNQIISFCEEIGAVPIINCVPCTSTSIQSAINNQILSLDTKHIRFDIATALNYDLDDGPDTSLFTDDGVHPNEDGYDRMFKRVLIDVPELFNF